MQEGISAKKANKIEELESIRGLAALLVVGFHLPGWNQLFYNISVIRNGYLMVDLFFVLSGFVIYSAYNDKIKKVKELVQFQFLRLGRLYPVHLFFLLIFILLEVVKLILQRYFGIASPNSTPFKENNLIAVFQQFFLVQSIGPTGNAHTFNGPAWSISVEFYTYLIFSFLQLIAIKFKNMLMFVLFSASLFLLLLNFFTGFNELLSCITGFFLGCLTSVLARHVKFKLKSKIIAIPITLILLFLAFKTNSQYNFLIYFLSSSLILAIVLSENGFLKRILNLKLLTWFGTISYSIYMSHACIIWIVNQAVRAALKRHEIIVDGASTPQLSSLEAFLVCLITISLVLLVSNLTYAFIEKPFRERSRRLVFGMKA